jgi:hypothetical protein
MFQDLTYSLEIAAHAAGLEHYGLHMDFDAVTAIQRYHESFALEEWTAPFHAHAEIEFELGPLDIARFQLSRQAIAETIGATTKGGEKAPIVTQLDVTFSLSVSALGDLSSNKWIGYCSQVAAHNRLQAGLENLKRSVQRAISEGRSQGEAQHPALGIQAHTVLAESGHVMLNEISAHWWQPLEVDVEDSSRQARLEDVMKRVRAGLKALDTFAQDIEADFEAAQDADV